MIRVAAKVSASEAIVVARANRLYRKPPLERRDLIAQWRSRLNYDALPKLRSWGITVDKNVSLP